VKRALLALVFVATVVGTAALVSRIPGGLGPLVAMARGIPAPIWAAVLLASAAFYLLDYLRFYTLLRILGHRIGAALGLELTCVSYFVSSLTPTADLHLPAMIFILARHGVPAGDGAAASITKSVYQVTWIVIVALVSLAFSGLRLPAAAAASLWGAAVPLIAIVVAFALVILFPASSPPASTRVPRRSPASGARPIACTSRRTPLRSRSSRSTSPSVAARAGRRLAALARARGACVQRRADGRLPRACAGIDRHHRAGDRVPPRPGARAGRAGGERAAALLLLVRRGAARRGDARRRGG
jgi:uncharacterized membrane protein YbhN (UPF0104 family)